MTRLFSAAGMLRFVNPPHRQWNENVANSSIDLEKLRTAGASKPVSFARADPPGYIPSSSKLNRRPVEWQESGSRV
jgi:hypothetical protein